MRTLALVLSVAILGSAAAAGQASWASTPPPGNEAAGAAIVAGKGNCLTCHRIRSTGSRSGPDLTDIGATRTIEQLTSALLDPDAEILPENRFYRVVTRDGMTVTGRLLNHDTFQVLLRDSKDQLRSFFKSDLREYGFVEKSSMPSFRTTLSPQELADVIAYLGALEGVVAE
jgi:putative heme-binding domain-containing protein